MIVFEYMLGMMEEEFGPCMDEYARGKELFDSQEVSGSLKCCEAAKIHHRRSGAASSLIDIIVLA